MLFASPAFHQFVVKVQVQSTYNFTLMKPLLANEQPNAALQMWRSADSSLQQRADAVTKLIPKGASKEEVERALARKGMWTRYHGPSFDALNHRQLPDHDYWRLVYEFPGGGVSLEFEPSTAFGDRFVRVFPFQTLMSVPLTNSP
jgi:hypothetical protein